MTYATKHAVIATTVWFTILVALVLMVSIPGATAFADREHSVLRLLTAAVILPGFVMNTWLLVRQSRLERSGDYDERDSEIARRASEITLIVLAICVYAASLALYEWSADAGTVSRGWLYLMAYGTVSLVSFVHAASFLILNRRGWTDA